MPTSLDYFLVVAILVDVHTILAVRAGHPFQVVCTIALFGSMVEATPLYFFRSPTIEREGLVAENAGGFGERAVLQS